MFKVRNNDLFEQLDKFIDQYLDQHPEAEHEEIIEQFLSQNSGISRTELQKRLKQQHQQQNEIKGMMMDVLDENSVGLVGLKKGQILDNYRILSRLSNGGMGEIYIAERADGQFDKQVAIKILSKGLITNELIQRFLRERQILASLHHPNIVPLLDAGMTENNRPWFALEYIKGKQIDKYCQQYELNVEQIVVLFSQVCDGIIYAHSHGIIHRDLKPANILVHSSQGVGRPMILDFGIASQQQAEAMTSTGQIIGTPGFMSPEQTIGQTVLLDGRSDVFSLGVILYQLVNTKHEHPFIADSITEVNFKVLKEDAPELPRNSVNPNLAAIIYKCLEKEPVKRYQSVKSLLNDLQSFLSGDPVNARKISWLQRQQIKIRKHPLISTLVTVLILSVLGFSWLLIEQKIKSSQQAQRVQKYAFISKEIENKVRQQHMLPQHNLSNDYDEINQSIQQIFSQIEKQGSINNGPIYAALGQAYLLLSQADDAVKAFAKYAQTGFTNPENEIQYALALALAWEQRQGRSKHIVGEKNREKELEFIDRSYLRPATQKLQENLKFSRQSIYLQAYLAFLNKDYTRTVSLAESAYKNNSGLYEALRLAGQALFQKGILLATAGKSTQALDDYNRSVEFLNQALNIGRSDLKGHSIRCELLRVKLHAQLIGGNSLDEESFIKAEKACLIADSVFPGQLDINIKLTGVYHRWTEWLGELNLEDNQMGKKALTQARKTYAMAPDNLNVLTNMVLTLLQISQFPSSKIDEETQRKYINEAKEYATKSVKINPKDATNWANLGDIDYTVATRFLKTQDIRDNAISAFASYQKANNLSPSYAWVYMMGMSMVIQGEYYLFHEDFHLAKDSMLKSKDLLVQVVTQAKDFAFGWKALMQVSIELIKINQQLNNDNESIINDGLRALEKMCQLYVARGEFPKNEHTNVAFFRELLPDKNIQYCPEK